MSATHLLASGLLAALYTIGVSADGIGIIGYGKTLYDPTCSFACRNVIRRQPLLCTPVDSTANHGTAHNPVTTPPDCFINDHVFLTTMALCIDTYCPLTENPSRSKIEDYWAHHLGTGTLGTDLWTPVMSYQDALAAAREEEARVSNNGNSSSMGEDGHGGHSKRTVRLSPRQHGGHSDPAMEGLITFDVSSPLPLAAGGSSEMLNVTSFVGPDLWQLQYNYMYDFEVNEAGHSTMTIVVAVVAIFLPIVLSLFRYIPGLTRSRAWTYWQSFLFVPAAMGRRHREPLAGSIGLLPNRGQALYIFVISAINILLWLGPYVIHQPQASFTSLKMQTISIVGNRAGNMAMGNAVALFLFAARNNVLLSITDWSHGTYLLLHRWLGYWCVFHTIIHSVLLLANYVLRGTYEDELAREYWIWGIVGTVAVSVIPLFSVLWIRQKFYEAFLAGHIILAILFLVGYYYHIWYVYEYNWGYEIWAFVCIAIWALDRIIRVVRTAWQGSRVAVVTAVQDVDGEYLRIEIEDKRLEGGVAYLGFPMLGWKFWETHPFSVAYSGPGSSDYVQPAVIAAVTSDDKTVTTTTTPAADSDPEKGTSTPQSTSGSNTIKGDSTLFFTRVRDGITKQLASRVNASNQPVRLRVLLEGPYHHSGDISTQLSQCNGMLCIAGGVGITACLPYVRQGATGSTKLFWSSRHTGLVTALGPALTDLPSSVQVETVVGQRLDLDAILAKELIGTGGKEDGALAVVVCGPPSMADDVRQKIVEIARTNPLARPYVLLDEAFGW